MKKIRKALSVCLVLLLVLTSIPVVHMTDFDIGITASALDATGQCGENVTYTFDSETGELVISGEGAIEAEAFHKNKEILKVVIESGVTVISDKAFCECEELAEIVIGDDVTIIGTNAFFTCQKLDNIAWGSGLTKINIGAFACCSSLTTLEFPSNMDFIGFAAFEDCVNLESIVMPNSVTTIGEYAFVDCINLTDVYYNGSEEEWNAISIGKNNDELKNATIHFAEVPECGHANVTLVPQVDATCTENGVIEYYYCADCEGKLALNEGFYEYLDGSEEIPSLGHGHTLGFDEISAVPATCTADGNTAGKYCKDCGVYYDGYEVIASEGHKWSENYVKMDKFNHGKKCSVCGEFSELAEHESELVESIPATCVSEGIKIYQCVCGYEYLITIPVITEHQWGEWFETAAPTCTEAGSEIRRCTVAGCSKSEEQTVAALGHTLTNIPMVDSTCEKEGTAEHYKCNVCGNLFSDEEGKIATAPDELVIAKKAHTYTKYEIVKNATCTTQTLERAYCDACNKATDERYVGELLPHVFKNYVSDKNATCIEDGTLTAVCENCKTATDTVADTGSMATAPHTPDDTGVVCKLCDKYLGCMHTYTTEKFITRTPTCTANGVKAMYCTKCYINKPGTEEILPATGHSWDAGEVIKESSCSEHGLQIFRCKNINCEAAETKELPLAEHNYKEEIIEATCTEDGYSIFTCTECKSNYVDKAVKAYGHMFDTYTYDEGTATCYMDGTKTSKCANACGATKTITDEGSKIDHVMNEFKVIKAADCLNDGEEEARCLYYEKCGYSELVPVDAYGHDYVYNEGYEATCTEDGRVEGASCIRCNYGADILVIPARGHDFPIEWSELLAPDCLSRGVRVKICNDCNYLKSEVIPQTGHYDEDSNRICDICNKDVTVEELEPTDKPEKACDCNCHAGGIKAFFFNFINFFAKIFDKDARTCKCGKSH